MPKCMDCKAPVEPGFYAHCRKHRLIAMGWFWRKTVEFRRFVRAPLVINGKLYKREAR